MPSFHCAVWLALSIEWEASINQELLRVCHYGCFLHVVGPSASIIEIFRRGRHIKDEPPWRGGDWPTEAMMPQSTRLVERGGSRKCRGTIVLNRLVTPQEYGAGGTGISK